MIFFQIMQKTFTDLETTSFWHIVQNTSMLILEVCISRDDFQKKFIVRMYDK